LVPENLGKVDLLHSLKKWMMIRQQNLASIWSIPIIPKEKGFKITSMATIACPIPNSDAKGFLDERIFFKITS